MKSKSTNLARGVFSWFCFMLVVFTMIFVLLFSFYAFATYGGDIIDRLRRSADVFGQVASGELRELDIYKENASGFFERLFFSTQSGETVAPSDVDSEDNVSRGVRYFFSDGSTSTSVSTVYVESISKDNLYSITDASGKTITNDPNWIPGSLPNGFNYLFQCQDGIVEIFHLQADGSLECVFRSDEPGAYYTDTLAYTLESLRGLPDPPYISFVVRAKPESHYASNEIVSSAQTYANQLLFQMSLIVTATALFILILILSFLFRRDRQLFETYLAHGLKWIWIEIKIIAILVWSYFILSTFTQSGSALVVALCAVFFMLYLLGIDISHNRNIYRHNVVHSILKIVLANKNGKHFEQIEYRKYLATAGILLGLGIAAFTGTLFCVGRYPFESWLPAFYTSLAIAGVGTLLWFAAALRDDLRDYGVLMDQIEKMYNGDLNAVNTLPATSPLYGSAMQLNMIRDGIKIAVEAGIQSERTKVELITNVSHDIKTPLTSIISYVELLKAEPDLPPHVVDYIQVLSQKSERLRHMIQDIFDVSKAATGNIALEPEHLGLDKLLRQTLADMDAVMQESPLQWRVQIPDEPFPVYVDGQKMYRVFQNLIKNAAQYALDGSRVYITLAKHGENACFTIQNISKYELTMDGETLTARFVRGDDSRSIPAAVLASPLPRASRKPAAAHAPFPYRATCSLS